MHFADRLFDSLRRVGNPICVGLDPRPEDLPADFLDAYPHDVEGRARAIGDFGCEVLDLVAGSVAVVKFQAAYYEAYGPAGMLALHRSAAHAGKLGLLTIMDGKRNDIGSTAEAYARAYLGKVPVGDRFEAPWAFDALTVNPYLGSDGVAPFAKVAAREGKGVFVLVRTSNASAREFQDLESAGSTVFEHVADRAKGWAASGLSETGYGCVGAVVGATYPAELARLRERCPGLLFLVPGYGTQGGTALDIAPAFDPRGFGALVNNSRGITQAFQRPAMVDRFGPDWRAAIRCAVDDMAEDLARNTPASALRES